ncbi:MAG: ribosome maturation factor RimM [Candidatus Nanopelagicales bacterium]
MLLVVGRVGRANGIHGFVSVELHTDAPEERFAPGASVSSTTGGQLRVAATRWQSGRLLVRFEGVTDRTGTEALRGLELSAEVDVTAASEDPEEYHDQALIGLRAVDPAGEPLGVVADVLHLPAQDELVLATTDGQEVLVPFVVAIVPSVDLATGLVVVDAPPGLFEEVVPEGPGHPHPGHPQPAQFVGDEAQVPPLGSPGPA